MGQSDGDSDGLKLYIDEETDMGCSIRLYEQYKYDNIYQEVYLQVSVQ